MAKMREDINQIKRELSEIKKALADICKDHLRQKRDFEIVGLPSCGFFYPNNTQTLYVGLLTYNEELLMVKPYFLENPDLLMDLLKRLIITENFDVTHLLACDIQAISMFLSAYSYGDEREIEVECPECGKNEPKFKFKISDFQAKEFYGIPDENRELPVHSGKHIIKIKPKTFIEELEFNKVPRKELEKIAFNIVELNGERDPIKIQSLLNNMKILDAREVKKVVKENLPGIISTIKFHCAYCDQITDLNFSSEGAYFLKLPESYVKIMQEELFLLSYYGETVTATDAKNMTVLERKWWISRISEEKEKQRKAEEAEMAKAKTKSSSKRSR